MHESVNVPPTGYQFGPVDILLIWLVFLNLGLGIFTMWRCQRRGRNGSALALWLLFIWSLPLLGSLACLYFNRRLEPAGSPLKKLRVLAFVTGLLALLCVAISLLEYTVLNFGDSDLPPYQPDTPLERACDEVWFSVSCGAAVLSVWTIAYFIMLLFQAIKKRAGGKG